MSLKALIDAALAAARGEAPATEVAAPAPKADDAPVLADDDTGRPPYYDLPYCQRPGRPVDLTPKQIRWLDRHIYSFRTARRSAIRAELQRRAAKAKLGRA